MGIFRQLTREDWIIAFDEPRRDGTILASPKSLTGDHPMKMLWLLATLMITTTLNAQTVNPAAASLTFPRVVGKVALRGQTQSIPQTTIVKVTHSGMYRVTTYLTQTAPGTCSGQTLVDVNFTDGAGVENYNASGDSACGVPPYAYGTPDSFGMVANSFAFSAVKGTPITFNVYGIIEGTYDLFIVVEELT
jgi:hypothetical protein